MTTPVHDYKTVEGTEPAAHAKHEPRSVVHTVTTGSDADLYMMTEIGDGVFVQWGECRRCNLRVGFCKCPEGPQEPPYMQPWHDKRFAKSLDARLKSDFDDLPIGVRDELVAKVWAFLEERGYKIDMTVEQQLAEATPYDPDTIAIPDLTDQERDDLTDALGELRPPHLPERYLDREVEDLDLPGEVDSGLDEALEKVRSAKQRDVSALPDEF